MQNRGRDFPGRKIPPPNHFFKEFITQNRLSQNSLKVFVHLFQKVVGCRGNALTRTPQSPEPPKLPKEFLFLLLFLLDKGEKDGQNDLNYKRAVAFSPFLKLMRQPLHDCHMNDRIVLDSSLKMCYTQGKDFLPGKELRPCPYTISSPSTTASRRRRTM